MPRWLQFLALVVCGLAAGVAYGWYLAPVEYVDTTPASLRIDYRADYVLMVAEAYRGDHNVEAARRKLAALGASSASAACEEAIAFAAASAYGQADLDLLTELQRTVRLLEAASTPTAVSP